MPQKIKIYFNGTELKTVSSVRLQDASISGNYTKQYTIGLNGFKNEFAMVRNAIKESDNNFITVEIDGYGLWLKGYATFAKMSTTCNQDGVDWSLSGGDIFNAIDNPKVKIKTSAFPNPPIYLTGLLGSILEELNYIKKPTTQAIKRIVNGKEEQVNILTKNYEYLNLKPNATKGVDFIKLDSALSNADILYSKTSDFPRPNNLTDTSVSDFLHNLLGFRNLFLLSDGSKFLTITRAGLNKTSIGHEIFDIVGRTTLSAATKNISDLTPCFLNYIVNQNNIQSIIGNKNGNQFNIGLCVDKAAIPHYQSINFVQNILGNQDDAIKLAQLTSNARRTLGFSLTYTKEGSFFSDTNTLYQANKYITIQDKIHDYQGDMLIHNVLFDYDIPNGYSRTVFDAAPFNGFTTDEPEQIFKIMKKNVVKK